MKKSEKGITLIALVITIIVLLILAGVSIAMLTGNNGILTQAQRAKEETEQAGKNEQADLITIEESLQGVAQVNDENPGELEGEGTENKPFVINSIEDLVVFAYNVTNGNTYEGQYVKLGQSLDFNSDKSYVDPNRKNYYEYQGKLKEALISGEGFKSIGKIENVENLENYSFKGIFDGNNKAIYNMYINKNIEDNLNAISLGMFSTNYGIVKKLTVSGSISLVVSNQDRKSRRNNRRKLWDD